MRYLALVMVVILAIAGCEQRQTLPSGFYSSDEHPINYMPPDMKQRQPQEN